MQFSINIDKVRKYFPLLLLLIVLTLAFTAGVLFKKIYQSAKIPQSIKEKESEATPQTTSNKAGEIDIREQRSLLTSAPYKEINIGKIRIKDYKLKKLSLEGNKVNLLELTISYLKDNIEKDLVIPIIDKFYYMVRNPKGEYSRFGFIPVTEDLFEKGALATLSLIYLPQSSSENSFAEWCSSNVDDYCTYRQFGFGTKLVDINAYLDDLLESDKAGVDYKISVVSELILIQQTE